MVRKARHFARVFIKIMLDEKISYLWSVLAPVVFFLYAHQDWFDKLPDNATLLRQLGFYWAYIIYIVLINGVAVALIRNKEYGFLKTFEFIAGSPYPILIGLSLTYLLQAFACVAIFTAACGLVFSLAVGKLLLLSLLTLLVSAIPMCFLMMVIPVLIRKTSSAAAFLNLSLVVLFSLTGNIRFDRGNPMELPAMLNPMEFIMQLSTSLSWIFGYRGYAPDWTVNGQLACITVVYLLLGVWALRRFGSQSAAIRT